MIDKPGVPTPRHPDTKRGVLIGPARQFGVSSRFLLPIGLMSCWLLLSCAGGDPKSGAARANVAQPVPVSVSTAERQDMPYYLTGLGSVSAFYTDSIKTRVDGELVEVNFKEGQFVNKGDLLVVIDPRPYQVA
ncbi:MAG TPA: biotin/lipoyl-binding protein, partial [Terriglobales bacterium]|nr:biotin/lipoyl-binding protein [Terriglobales bacterium]